MSPQSVSFFGKKGVGLGSVYDYTSPSVEEFLARQARTRLYCTVCESSVSFYKLVRTLAVGEESTLWRGRAPVGESAPLCGRARPCGKGHVHFDLVGEKGRAPLGKGSFKVSQ